MIVGIVGLKQEEGVELFINVFSHRDIEKAYEESKLKESRYSRYKSILVDFQKINRLFMRFNRLFLSIVNKNKLKQIQ